MLIAADGANGVCGRSLQLGEGRIFAPALEANVVYDAVGAGVSSTSRCSRWATCRAATARELIDKWNGMEWNGMEWNGIIFGMEWNGVERNWNGMEWKERERGGGGAGGARPGVVGEERRHVAHGCVSMSIAVTGAMLAPAPHSACIRSPSAEAGLSVRRSITLAATRLSQARP